MFLSIYIGAQAQVDTWGGGFPDDKISVATNWVGGVVPPNYTAGTDTLVFNDASDSNLKVNVSGISFLGLQVTDPSSNGNDAFIYGTSGLTIKTGGITLVPVDAYVSLSLNVPVALATNQTWSTGGNGSIVATGVISGAGALTLAGGSNQSFEFDSGASTFTGGLTVTGSGTVLSVGATGTPFGTGPLSIGDGVTLQPTTSTALSLANAVSFGDGSATGTVMVGSNPSSKTPLTTSISFTGNAIFNQNQTGNMDSEIDLYPNTTLTFSGTLSGGTGGVCIDIGTVNSAQNAVAVISGNFGTGLQRFDVEDTASVIFDGNAAAQVASINANLEDIGTSATGYIGLGENYVGSVASFLASPKISPSGFTGTLGLDTVSGGTATFTDAIDLTGFTSENFVGIGSATKAILSGTITPPGGFGLESGTYYVFGGGGGYLQVTSALTDSSWNSGDGYDSEPNTLFLNPGNGPLTLVLSGALSYTGETSVTGGVLIFDTPLPTGSLYINGGYVGNTPNAGIADSSPQTFINALNGSSSGVVGFDSLTGMRTITGNIGLSELGSNLYLGTATQVTYTGSITPAGTVFQFSGVKGGQVTVESPSLSDSGNSVTIGLPSPIESFGSVSSVFLPTTNTYSGITTLNSGYLLVGSSGSIGTNTLVIADPNSATVGLAPSGADVTLPNAITLPDTNVHLNQSTSGHALTLTGAISGSGNLIIDGPTTLAGNNTFTGNVIVNGTAFTAASDSALEDAASLKANTGSTIVFNSTLYPYVNELDLTGSTATFTVAGSTVSPEIDDLSMAMGSQLTFANNTTPSIYGLQSDAPGSGNVITLGTGTALYLSLGTDPDYHGTFVGTPTSSIELASGNLNLSGSNVAYQGTISVDSTATLIASNNNALGTGTVTVSGTLATNTGVTVTNAITLNNGATLGGFGTFSPGSNLAFQSGSTLIPGSATLTGTTGPSSIPAIGTLSFGGGTSLTFGSGGNLIFGIADANGSAGVGYSTVSVSGGLTVGSSPGSPFGIDIYSFAPGNNVTNSTQAANFNPLQAYSWTLVSTNSGITWTNGYSTADFTISSGSFLNPTAGGQFSVSQSGNNLMLNFTPVPEPSTWALMASGAFAVGAAWRRRRS